MKSITLLFAACLLLTAAQAQPETLKLKPAANRREMPALPFELLAGGKGKVADLKGKVVYIQFWSSQNMVCVERMPQAKALMEQFKGKNVEFLFISLDGSQKNAKAFVAREALGGTQAWMHNDAPVLDKLQVQELPRFLLIDLNGKIYDMDAKGADKIAPTIEQLLQE